ncbi:hypothetical protein N9Y06_03710, partial [Flavobacteriales bacterium]|nr:hypothetical protein [Flavobacteriales bacterium]
GHEQVMAGYVLYGTSTVLIYTCGHGVHAFTLEPSTGKFTLTNEALKTPVDGNIFSINEGNYHTLEKGIQNYIGFCKKLNEKGAVIVLDPKKSFENDTDAAAMLNIDKEAYAALNAKFSFTIDNISRMEPAELNVELYDKIYGEGVVKNEKEFREKITAESENMFVGEADRKFQNDAVDYLLEKTSFDLPEEFLKRWMQTVSEKPVTIDEIEKDFEGYKKSLKWQIIENKIAKENEISVSREEAVAETKKLITAQMAQYGQLSPEEEQLEQYAQQVLANKEEEKNIYDRLFSSKMTAFFKESFKINEKEISYEKFVKLVQA